jgi:cation diffusion facilitator CzcD-associated flavoprotein CzcO
VAQLTQEAFAPGKYPVVIVGSGPGALQLSYSLRGHGVEHAVISEDPAPGGMFRRWPIFQRMLSWTKPFADHEHGSAAYERFDWNSLLGEDDRTRAIMPDVMDGSSYFPSRPEMEKGLVTFAERAGIKVRYGCRWESTRQEAGEFVLTTSDGEYRAQVAVFAVGVAEPWRPPLLQVEGVQQYGELRPVDTSASRIRVSRSPPACCRRRARSSSPPPARPGSRSTRGRWWASVRATCSPTRTGPSRAA